MHRALTWVAALLMLGVALPSIAQSGSVEFSPPMPQPGTTVDARVSFPATYDIQWIVIELSSSEILIRLRGELAFNPFPGMATRVHPFTAPAAGMYPYRVVLESFLTGEVYSTLATGTLTVQGVTQPQPSMIPVGSSMLFALLGGLIALAGGVTLVHRSRLR